MVTAGKFLALGQEELQVTTPPSRVLARAQAFGPSRVQDPFDAAAQP
jgi:hypothetical protein